MKGFQWLTFTLLSLTSIALIITGMATKHWTATRSGDGTIFSDQSDQQTYGGLRRWYSGDSDSQAWNRDLPASNEFYEAGSWALGWGITALILIVLSHIAITLVKSIHALHGLAGKVVSAGLMLLAAVCILIGCITYWSHLPDGYDTLSWSYALYAMGGGLAFITSILLCSMPNKHYVGLVTKTAQPALPMYAQSGQQSRTSSLDAVVAPNRAPAVVVQ